MPKTPAHLRDRFSKLIESNTLRCGVLSVKPAVLHCQLYPGYAESFVRAYRPLFQALAPRPLHCLCSLGGPVEEMLPVAVDLTARLHESFPQIQPQFLCNVAADVNQFAERGLRAVFCNHNAFIDERIYRPLEGIDKEFDAVYDARPLPAKRHHLASDIASLAFLYYVVLGVDDPNYVAQFRQQFRHAHFFNHEEGAYRPLLSAEIVRVLNRCRVGLCLSAAEGGMYASIQYLLCGLSVVSTPSSGGRAEFFDERYCRVVEPDPASIEKGVAELISLAVDPWLIRQATLTRMQAHRQRLIATVQAIFQSAGETREFALEWPALFSDKILHNYKLGQLIGLLQHS